MESNDKSSVDMKKLSELRQGAVVLDPIQKAAANPRSRSLAIRGKCYECQGCDADPCWQWRVGNCDITGCSLHPLRPYQGKLGTPTPAALRQDA